MDDLFDIVTRAVDANMALNNRLFGGFNYRTLLSTSQAQHPQPNTRVELPPQSPVQCAMDYHTIRIFFGRRVGYSSMIAALAAPGDIIVVPDIGSARSTIERMWKIGKRDITPVVTPARSTSEKFNVINNVKIDYSVVDCKVWVDEPAMIERYRDIHFVYEHILQPEWEKTPTFIMLGR